MKIVSRQHAKSKNLKYYFTNRPCKFGHITKRRVSNSVCYECELNTSKNKRDKNRKILYDAKYHSQNWNHHYQKHKTKYLARSATNRARRARALPSWFQEERKQIYQLYKLAQYLSETLGIPHHVDHVVPIKNNNVCGLHCYANLRIIPAKENLQKSNKF